jgi:hypothetical protein
MSMRRPEIPSVTSETSETSGESAGLKWADLSETEKSAASLGVDPEHWKPIAFMNDAHYDTLLKANAIDGELAKKLEAFKHVAGSK